MSANRVVLRGFRSIDECLRLNPERIQKLQLPKGKRTARLDSLRKDAERSNVCVEEVHALRNEDDACAILKGFDYADFDTELCLLEESASAGNRPLVIVLDGITDPNNLGAILRTAAFMGVDLVVLPRDRSASINDAVYRIASGGLEHIKVAQVVNISSALKELKDKGFWIVGLSEHAPKTTHDLSIDFPAVLVVGNEEKGIRHLTAQTCDFLVQIARPGRLGSLNASVAAGIAMAWAKRI